MRLVIVGHPRKRMLQRGITEADIRHALANVRSSWETPKGSVQYVGPGLDGRELKVWVLLPGITSSEAEVVIKSVAWKGQED